MQNEVGGCLARVWNRRKDSEPICDQFVRKIHKFDNFDFHKWVIGFRVRILSYTVYV